MVRGALRVWLWASAMGTMALGAERTSPEGSSGQEGGEARAHVADRFDPLAPVPRQPAYGRAAIEMAGLLALGTAHYWMNAETNSKDWDFPRWSERWDSRAVRFDNNRAVTNNVLHPLAGAAYYGMSRANGLGVGSAALYTVASSAIWEWGIEWREKVSINDMIATTVGGVAAGEFFVQLAAYLNSGSETNGFHQAAKTTLGFPVWIHDQMDRRKPEAPSSRDNLGFSSKYAHRFSLGYENQWLAGPEEQSHELRGVALDAWLASMPGFLEPTTFARSFAQGNFSAAALNLQFDGGGLREAEMRFEAVLAGHYAQRANPGLVGALLGLATGIEFVTKDTLEQGDEYALVHVLGPDLRATWNWKDYGLEMRLSGFADFAAIRSLAWPAVNLREPEAKYKSSLERRYQYHVGLSSRLSIDLRILAAHLSAELRLGSYQSIQGFDRFQEQITRDLAGAEVFDERRLGFALEPPRTPLRVYGQLEENRHETTLGGQAGERVERRSLIGFAVVF
jgi:hypothetical protein